MRLLHKRQAGVALLLAMIFLVVLTLIGITSLRTASLEQKMTANQKDYYLAFEAAEFALRTAEQSLQTIVSTSSFSSTGGSGGLYMGHTLSSNIWEDGTLWDDDDKVISVSDSSGFTTVNPKYIVEVLTTFSPGSEDLQLNNDYGESTDSGTITIFRITARGESGKGSVVYLQSMYSRSL